ncbi:YhfG family protein [Methyloprofundus sp.]|uniref:YhfG family protein n=1 Tax=Methyloprofundus sp. TaxID=2020875 RepID=UPI003D0BA5E3
MNYELSILAAITRLEHPSTKKIVIATGISERKVQNVIKSLSSDFHIKILRKNIGRSNYFVVKDWGVFESGNVLRKKLDTIELKIDGELMSLLKKSKPLLLTTFSEKHEYFEKVKTHNFKESLRLEGYSINIEDYPVEKPERKLFREELIKKYSQYKDPNLPNKLKAYG